ncbi:MAG: FG-GAP-like repeat-containing protein, partial [Chloroflexi bacterium]|nr:FG-GAP-like repeat-containing protein [Chloroflexota bacterium]
MDVADLNGDGRPDVATGEHRGSLKVTVWQNVNNGASWSAHTVGTGKESHLGTRLADLDRDGDIDIVSIAWDAYQYLHVWRNNAKSGAPLPVPASPGGLAATAVSSSQINLSWTDNASNETGFQLERATSSSGPWTQIATPGANATSATDSGLAASTTYFYRVRAANGSGSSAYSNVANATTPSGGGGGGSVPSSGLQLWLKADGGVTQSGGAVSAWADQSGNGRTAAQSVAASRPTLVSGATGGLPAVQFDGINDHLTFTLPVNGMTGMTLVLVSACTADRTGGGTNAENAAIFWNETASWGTVYLSPFQSNVKFRFGTTQSGNLPSYARPSSIGSAFSTSIAVKSGTTDTLFVNGVQVLSQGGKLGSIAGCRATGNLGRGYNDNTFFPGRIAEVLVYNRALSTAERQGIEQYLAGRYAGSLPAVAGVAAPAGGSLLSVTAVSTGKDPVLTTAAPGALPYLDRSTSIGSLDPALAGGALVRLANDDKDVVVADHLTLVLSAPTTLHVGLDPRAPSIPAWLADGTWTLGGEQLSLSDGGATPMIVYRRSFPAGTAVLGGPGGSPSSYVLIATWGSSPGLPPAFP